MFLPSGHLLTLSTLSSEYLESQVTCSHALSLYTIHLSENDWLTISSSINAFLIRLLPLQWCWILSWNTISAMWRALRYTQRVTWFTPAFFTPPSSLHPPGTCRHWPLNVIWKSFTQYVTRRQWQRQRSSARVSLCGPSPCSIEAWQHWYQLASSTECVACLCLQAPLLRWRKEWECSSATFSYRCAWLRFVTFRLWWNWEGLTRHRQLQNRWRQELDATSSNWWWLYR